MTWENLLLSAVVSALVSLLVGPVRAKLEEAAKAELRVRRELQAQLNQLLLILEQEVENRSILKSGGRVPAKNLLGIDDLDAHLWKLVRLSDDPNVDPYRRRLLQEEVERIAPRHYAYLRALDKPPPVALSPDSWPSNRRVFVGYVATGGGMREDLIDKALDPGNQKDPERIRELEYELRSSLGPLLEAGWLGLRVRTWLRVKRPREKR